ncbi:transcriptional regulator [Vibrio fluvialis]|uniref:transcriptional regulator n=1 Tax=Vibrio fluvialis TaxID=676 RepID=UPI0023AA1299|nr:transcriptional regulator [Vibrio fluvialis]MDE5179897.1 transcriptional regulator [Vibrio fluvialis]
MTQAEIRSETLTAFGDGWAQPTGEEVRQMLSKCELSASKAAALVGVSDARTVRKWTSYDPIEVEKIKQAGKKSNMQKIPYAAWAVLAESAGYGCIWKN